MSIDAFIYTRTEPAFGMQEHDVVTIERVQILKPRPVVVEDWRRLRRAPDPTIRWVTDANCTNASYVQLEMFAQGLARRCGGGVWWCDLTDQVIEVASAPDPGGWSLREALEVAQDVEADLDESDLMDASTNPPSESRGGTRGHTVFEPDATERAWQIGVAKRGNADGWMGTAPDVQVFALLEGHGANHVGKYTLGTMRRALDQMRGHQAHGPIGDAYAAEPPAAWIQRTHAHAQLTTFKKRFLRGRPQGWGTISVVRADANQLRIAHVGDARAYLISARCIEQLATEQLATGPHDPASHHQPASAIGAGPIQPEERSVPLAPDQTITLLSYEVWRALGPELATVLTEAARVPDAKAGADAILHRAPGATCAAVVVAHHQRSSPKPASPGLTTPAGSVDEDSGLPLFLVIENSSDRALVGRRIELASARSPITVGRDPACTLEVRSETVSMRHARFERHPDGWHVVDEGSTSGTYVDDARVIDCRLREGQTVRVGDTLLGFAAYIVETQFRPGAADGLTGLPTKRHLLEHLATAMRSNRRPLAVVRIDVDKLKLINHDRGHETGDRILAELAARLRANLRSDEYAGRLGADDFVVVLADTDLRAASARAEELRAQLAAIAPVSVGAAELGPTHRDADELIYTAEKDLFARYRTPRRSD